MRTLNDFPVLLNWSERWLKLEKGWDCEQMYDYLRIPRRVEIIAILYAGWGPAGRIYIVGFVVVLRIHRFSITK